MRFFLGVGNKKANTKLMDLPFCITRKENAVWAKVLKSDCQEKSTKILISWQELKNQFLSFFVHG